MGLTQEDKLQFLSRLTTSICRDLQEKVISGAIPEDWDGIELRQLLADTFAREDRMPKRQKRYRNYVAVCANNRL